MAGILNFAPPTLIGNISGHRASLPFNLRCLSIRASTEASGTPVASTSESTKVNASVVISPPPNFKPPKPKRFGVRPDKIFDIIGASLALIFRLGTGVFVEGYSASFVSKDDIPSDQYAFEIGGLKLKESSKLGLRPEKPIEIYEFESQEPTGGIKDMMLDLSICRSLRVTKSLNIGQVNGAVEQLSQRSS